MKDLTFDGFMRAVSLQKDGGSKVGYLGGIFGHLGALERSLG